MEAVAIVRELIERFGIECDLKRGNLQTALKHSDAAWYQRHAEHMQEEYGFDIRYVDGAELEYFSGTDVFRGGLVEYASAHLHPLNYALGLAEAAQGLGVRIFENSRVNGLRPRPSHPGIHRAGSRSAPTTWCWPATATWNGWSRAWPARSCR